jgi:hypothetical protein
VTSANNLVLGNVNVGSGPLTVTVNGANSITQAAGTSIVQAAGAGTTTFRTGSGAITLTNAGNNLTGPVSVTNTGTNNVAITNASGITLGTVNMQTGTLTVNAAGAVTLTGVLSFVLNSGGPSFQLLIGPGATAVNLAGGTLAGTATGFLAGNELILVSNQSTAALTGMFTNGTSVTLGGITFSIAYNVGAGNAVVLRVPSAAPTGTPNQIFLTNLYPALLRRPVDNTGLTYYSGQLDLGVSRNAITAQIMNSTEYLTVQVTILYQTILRRAPDPAGLAANVASLRQSRNFLQLEATFFGSQEYFQTQGGGTTNGYLAALYRDLLGRALDPSGLATYSQQLSQGVSRSQVALTVQTSSEGSQRLVQQLYLQFLRRPADPVGLRAYSTILVNGGTEETVVNGLASSNEFYSLR